MWSAQALLAQPEQSSGTPNSSMKYVVHSNELVYVNGRLYRASTQTATPFQISKHLVCNRGDTEKETISEFKRKEGESAGYSSSTN
jgi:hypothetical protein